jgi:predicted 3-demethylubiquinone-9 3-methyltransferase (glyoxalase superfamily)
MKNDIYPCLWFDGRAKEVADFYCSVYTNSSILEETNMVVKFELSGEKFMCLNGGSQFLINPSISFFVIFETLEEVDWTWTKLMENGFALMPIDKYDWSDRYGWVQDKYGVSWQIALGNLEDTGRKFTPSLLFTGSQKGNAEKALLFYTSIFDESSVDGILRYTRDDIDVEGFVKHAQFRLGKNVFMAMDSSLPHPFSFNEAISFVIECENQKEIDYYWENLSAHPEAEQCGWLKDQFGISWQIIPSVLSKLMLDPQKSQRVTREFLKMKKLDVQRLINA